MTWRSRVREQARAARPTASSPTARPVMTAMARPATTSAPPAPVPARPAKGAPRWRAVAPCVGTRQLWRPGPRVSASAVAGPHRGSHDREKNRMKRGSEKGVRSLRSSLFPSHSFENVSMQDLIFYGHRKIGWACRLTEQRCCQRPPEQNRLPFHFIGRSPLHITSMDRNGRS